MKKPKIEDFIASFQFTMTSFNHILMDYREDEEKGGFVYKTIHDQKPYEHFVTYEQAQFIIEYDKKGKKRC